MSFRMRYHHWGRAVGLPPVLDFKLKIILFFIIFQMELIVLKLVLKIILILETIFV